MSVEPVSPGAVSVNAAETDITPRLASMRGITVGTLDAAPTGPKTAEIRSTVSGQALAGTLLLVGLMPAIVVLLVFGLTHRANLIASSPVWAWSACGVALAAVVVSAVRAGRSRAAGWARPAAIAVLLLTPAAVVLYLRLAQRVPAASLSVAAIALYLIALIALLFTTLGSLD